MPAPSTPAVSAPRCSQPRRRSWTGFPEKRTPRDDGCGSFAGGSGGVETDGGPAGPLAAGLLDVALSARYATPMSTTVARLLRQPDLPLVRFYKMDHLHDPVPLWNGPIPLGGDGCEQRR